MEANNEEIDARLVVELSEPKPNGDNNEFTEDFGNGKKRKSTTTKQKTNGESTEARRESHKIIEQKRRQKINEKINELRELLNYPDGSQNKAVVLQAAVDNIKNLKTVCNKLLTSHRQLQDDYLVILAENEKLKINETEDSKFNPTTEKSYFDEESKKDLPNLAVPDLAMSCLYDETLLMYPRNTTFREQIPSPVAYQTGSSFPEVLFHQRDQDSRVVRQERSRPDYQEIGRRKGPSMKKQRVK